MTGAPSVPQDVTALARGFNDFGLTLQKHLPDDGNCFYSPLSIGLALSMLIPGARGETRQELAGLLLTDPDLAGLPERLGALIESLSCRRVSECAWDSDESVERDVFRLHLANALFGQAGHPMDPDYLHTLSAHFSAALELLDFGQAEEAATKINAWVSEQTRGKIPQLIDAHMISPETRLVLVNAVYFFAEWENQFTNRATTPQPFHLAGGLDSVAVPMMWDEQELLYGDHPELDMQSLVIPYKAGMAMLVLLPAEGKLQAVEAQLSAALLERLDSERTATPVDLQLPRFSMRFQSPLRAILESMGVQAAFDRKRADFTGISSHPDGLAVDEVVHEARVRVDEHGTEAAAATAEIMDSLCEPEEEPVVVPFVVNRPFLFLIQDRQTGAVLFVGRVEHPEE